MSIYKIPLPLNILEAARERITWTLNTLPRVCVSFSGGKDSGLMLHLTAELARQMGKKICVLFIDWEAQFSCTINYVQSLRELYTDVIEEFYWVALPLTTQNSLSQYQPEWQCWEPDVEGTVAKLAMRQPFVLFKGLTFQKLCLPGAFRPGDHHNKMLRPG
ncbi:phosphoadenosine phosphosulfate reductase family protein, partial [Escherichia coli]|uniref:phosphoadenosine phosphosulfate reductase domain-containing protein n=3 Tax=Escherichia coli TaxID=562 RepID=UPI001CD0F1CB